MPQFKAARHRKGDSSSKEVSALPESSVWRCSGTSPLNSSLLKNLRNLLLSSPTSSKQASLWTCGYIFLTVRSSMTSVLKMLLFGMKLISLMLFGGESTRSLTLKYHPSEYNGSLYAHVFFAHSGYSPDPSDPEYQPQAAFGRTHPVVTYLLKSKADKKKSLLGNSPDSGDGQVTAKVVEDTEEDSKDDDGPVEWLSYWKPNITMNLVADFTQYPKTGIPPNIAPYLNIDPITENYDPTVFFNEFWLLRDKLIPLNEIVTELSLNLEVGPISMTKWQLFLQIDQSFQTHRSYGSMIEGEAGELKRVFLEGNPYLLGVRMIVSLLHSVFDFLAFKNDIHFGTNINP